MSIETGQGLRAGSREQDAPTRGFWLMRDIPTAFWLALTVVAIFAQQTLPVPRWLMIHLLLLGAATHAIFVWSEYFSFALLRSRGTVTDRRRQNTRLILANAGIALVVVGVPSNVWALTVVGATSLIVAVLWHGLNLYKRMRRSLPGRFGHTIRYYITSAALLALGAGLGATVAHFNVDGHLALSHALLNLLGWIGITIAGTLVTLWPTILRTRADEFAATGSMRALPWLAVGVLLAALGAAFAWLPVLALGFLAYLGGLVVIAVSGWRAARKAPPRSFPALSVGLGFVWWIGALVVLLLGIGAALLRGGDSDEGFAVVARLLNEVVPFLAAGFVAQVLLGALSYLIPVVYGGGPRPVRVGTAVLDRGGPLRVSVANVALLVCALPVSGVVRLVASALYVIAMASFLVLMMLSMREQGKAKREKVQAGAPAAKPAPTKHHAGQAVAGLLAVVLAVTVAAVVDPAGLGTGQAGAVPDRSVSAADAPVTTVRVEAIDMRFTPDVIEVPAGNRLVIELVNTDTKQAHDLVLANGTASARLAPGASETIDAGVITKNLNGWCSISGHRQMGMTLTVVAVGGEEAADVGANEGGHSMPHDGAASSGMVDLSGEPGDGFVPFDAVLPQLPPADGPVTHHETLVVSDTEIEVAPGVTQTLWPYNKTAPGPLLHGRVGDTFVITLVNDASMGHSIDFHAGALAPDRPMRTIAPGEQLTYTFTATRSGIWKYHCSTMPMTAHIANGMYGAVVIEPDDLPEVDRSYVLTQGEYYLGDHDGGEVDSSKIERRAPDLVVFNGYANQYKYAPLKATVGERVRVWVLDAGIERSTSFHVVGGQFDTVWKEGQYLINRAETTGSQALGLMPAQGGFAELVFPEAGNYPFVSHFMTDAERGAFGLFAIDEE